MEYCPIVGNTLHRDTAYRTKQNTKYKKYISNQLSIVRGSSSSEVVPHLKTPKIYCVKLIIIVSPEKILKLIPSC